MDGCDTYIFHLTFQDQYFVTSYLAHKEYKVIGGEGETKTRTFTQYYLFILQRKQNPRDNSCTLIELRVLDDNNAYIITRANELTRLAGTDERYDSSS